MTLHDVQINLNTGQFIKKQSLNITKEKKIRTWRANKSLFQNTRLPKNSKELMTIEEMFYIKKHNFLFSNYNFYFSEISERRVKIVCL